MSATVLAEVARLALAMVEANGARRLGLAANRAAWVGAVTLGAVVCGVAAAGCAVAALWIRALPVLGPAGAPLLAAVTLLAMGGVLLLCRRLWAAPQVAPAALPLDEAARLFKENRIPVLLAALLAGVVSGRGDI